MKNLMISVLGLTTALVSCGKVQQDEARMLATVERCQSFHSQKALVKAVAGAALLSDGAVTAELFSDPAAAKAAVVVLKQLQNVRLCHSYPAGSAIPKAAFFVSSDALPASLKQCVEVSNLRASEATLVESGKVVMRAGSAEAAGAVLGFARTERLARLCVAGSLGSEKAVYLFEGRQSSHDGGSSHGGGGFPRPTPTPDTNGEYPARVTLYADNFSLDRGESTTIRWDSYKVSWCSLSKDGVIIESNVRDHGSLSTGSLSRDALYFISCNTSDGSPVVSWSVRVRVGSNPTCSSGEELFQGNCLPACPGGTFRDSFGGCRQNCSPGQEIFHGQCVARCPAGTSRDAFGGCRADSNNNGGIGGGGSSHGGGGANCPATMEIVNGNCVMRCPSTMERIGGSCVMRCPSTMERIGGSCLMRCPANHVRVNGSCRPNFLGHP